MSWIEERLQPFPLETVRAGGGRVSYRRAGDGPPVVLLHGISSGSGSWLHQLAGLAGRHAVVAWDAPGYGESDDLGAEWPEAADYAAVLADLVDVLGLDRFWLVGHSLGALMAAAFATRHPGALRGIVLAAPAAGHGDAPADERDARLRGRLEVMERLGPEGLAGERAAALLSSDPPREALDLVRWNMARLRPAGYARGARMLARGRLLADVATLSLPALVVCGGEDGVTPPAGARAVAGAAPDGRYVEIPRAGHVCYLERPEPFADALLGHLEAAR